MYNLVQVFRSCGLSYISQCHCAECKTFCHYMCISTSKALVATKPSIERPCCMISTALNNYNRSASILVVHMCVKIVPGGTYGFQSIWHKWPFVSKNKGSIWFSFINQPTHDHTCMNFSVSQSMAIFTE